MNSNILFITFSDSYILYMYLHHFEMYITDIKVNDGRQSAL